MLLVLLQVPKMLYCLRHAWAPSSFVVSFKLETDESILLEKVSLAWMLGLNEYPTPSLVSQSVSQLHVVPAN